MAEPASQWAKGENVPSALARAKSLKFLSFQASKFVIVIVIVIVIVPPLVQMSTASS